LDGEGGFCARGKLITSQKSKEENILPLGLTNGAILKRNINKNESIKLEDVELNLPDDIVKARQYQYDLI
jgi:predicted homoserine dehydrogenase-like protein